MLDALTLQVVKACVCLRTADVFYAVYVLCAVSYGVSLCIGFEFRRSRKSDLIYLFSAEGSHLTLPASDALVRPLCWPLLAEVPAESIAGVPGMVDMLCGDSGSARGSFQQLSDRSSQKGSPATLPV